MWIATFYFVQAFLKVENERVLGLNITLLKINPIDLNHGRKSGFNMRNDKIYFYLNNLQSEIPDNLIKLSEESKVELLKEWKRLVWTKSIQNNNQILSNIKLLPPIKIGVKEWLMDRLKESADHFVNGQWLSSIALSGTTCEFLTYYFIEEHITKEGVDKIIEYNRNIGSQDGRLQLLKKLGILYDEEYEKLDQIRKIRNKYIHLNKIDFNGTEAKEDSLSVLKNLIEFLNRRLIS